MNSAMEVSKSLCSKGVAFFSLVLLIGSSPANAWGNVGKTIGGALGINSNSNDGLGATIGGALGGSTGAAIGGLFDSKSKSLSSEENNKKNNHQDHQAELPKDGIEENALMYGDNIFIQSATESRRFLTVVKSDKRYRNPALRDPWKDYKESDYLWEILLPDSKGGNSKSDDCVRFGDVVFIKVAVRDITRKWLYNDNGEDAKTGEYNDNDEDKFKIVIRQSPGDDGDPRNVEEDPTYGQCVTDKTMVYLQSYYENYRWLNGHKKEAANFGDYFESTGQDDEQEKKGRFHWILRNETGSGSTDIGVECVPKGAVGKWVYQRTTYGGDTTVTVTVGNTRTKDESNTITTSWSASVSTTISANFAAGSASVTATGTYGQDAAKMVSNSLAETQDVSHATTWYTPGAIWQYVIETGDVCVPTWNVMTYELIQTNNKLEEPCCLPGYFADVDPVTNKANPRGFCAEDSPCMCGDFCDDPSRGKPGEEAGEGDAGGAGDEDERCQHGTEQELRSRGCFEDGSSGGGAAAPVQPGYGDYYGGYGDYYGGGYPMYDDYYGGGGGGYPMYDDYYGGGGGMYDDYYGPGGHHGGHHGHATQAPANPLLGYTGDKPLISLNINQANTNNNQGAGGNNPPAPAPTAPPAEEDDYLPPDFDDDYMYQGGDDYQAVDDDDDFTNPGDDVVAMDDDADTDDYLDVVLDALDGIEISARRKLRGTATTTASS